MFIPGTLAGAIPDKVPLLHETAEMLFQRVAVGPGDADHVTNGDAPSRTDRSLHGKVQNSVEPSDKGGGVLERSSKFRSQISRSALSIRNVKRRVRETPASCGACPPYRAECLSRCLPRRVF